MNHHVSLQSDHRGRNRNGNVRKLFKPADKTDMSSAVAQASESETNPEYRTTELPCVVCLTTLSLDEEGSKLATVRWEIVPYFGLRLARAIALQCPRGHSSDDEPELLRGYPSRRF